MNALRSLSILLMLPAIGLLIYDLVNEWFVNARFKVRTLNEVWSAHDKTSLTTARTALGDILSPSMADQYFAWPAPLALGIVPVALYLIYRIWFKVAGGQGSNAYKFKSRH
jgi:hypothetical protein